MRWLQAKARVPARGRWRSHVLACTDPSGTAVAEGTQVVAAEEASAAESRGGEQTAAADSTASAEVALSRAQAAVQKQQAVCSAASDGGQSPATLPETQRLVETAMLAAVSGLAYTLGSLLKVWLNGQSQLFLTSWTEGSIACCDAIPITRLCHSYDILDAQA